VHAVFHHVESPDGPRTSLEKLHAVANTLVSFNQHQKIPRLFVSLLDLDGIQCDYLFFVFEMPILKRSHHNFHPRFINVVGLTTHVLAVLGRLIRVSAPTFAHIESLEDARFSFQRRGDLQLTDALR
jgi:hypothetical protein